MSLTVTGKLTPKRAAPRPKAPKGPPPPSRAARMLALAHHIDDLIERGVLRDYADAARQLGITRARMSQVIDLLLLAPRIQEAVLIGKLRTAERGLRLVVREVAWTEQSPDRVCRFPPR